jgi:hypothetical protein
LRRLAQTEHHTRDYELAEAGDQPSRGLRSRPDYDGGGQQPSRADSVDQDAGRQLREGVRT